MKKYIVSKHDIYDSDRQLWKTEIGQESTSGPVLYSCWGSSPIKSRRAAEGLAKLLEAHQNSKLVK